MEREQLPQGHKCSDYTQINDTAHTTPQTCTHRPLAWGNTFKLKYSDKVEMYL